MFFIYRPKPGPSPQPNPPSPSPTPTPTPSGECPCSDCCYWPLTGQIVGQNNIGWGVKTTCVSNSQFKWCDGKNPQPKPHPKPQPKPTPTPT